jgi:6-pyruvoyltetrahydropterin/6-carboxytetrahydropterin synthase
MFSIKKEICFEMGHRLMDHPGKCANLHGHSYKVIFIVEGDADHQTGMVLDFYHFGVLKEHIDKKYDHAFMFNREDPVYELLQRSSTYPQGMKFTIMHGEPTAELIAEQLFCEATSLLALTQHMQQNGCRLVEVIVYETATCCASYRG